MQWSIVLISPSAPNADIQSPLDNRTDEINRQLQQINQLQNDVEIPQQAVIKLQDLLKSTDEQVEKLRHEKEKLKSKIHELEKQQTEKHQQQLSHNQGTKLTTSSMVLHWVNNVSSNFYVVSPWLV